VVDAEQAGTWINAGFFAFRPEIFNYMRPGEDLVIEPFERLINARKLAALPYDGFWRCCDTFKDYQTLENLHARGTAPWEVWRRPKSDFMPCTSATSAEAAMEQHLVS
jgi:glucose-1-phosphate cytidylyltransferase